MLGSTEQGKGTPLWPDVFCHFCSFGEFKSYSRSQVSWNPPVPVLTQLETSALSATAALGHITPGGQLQPLPARSSAAGAGQLGIRSDSTGLSKSTARSCSVTQPLAGPKLVA